jgi:uroporphyrinogen decarboxylase
MRQAGRYLPEYRALRAKHSFLETCKTPQLAAEVSLQPFRILAVDAVIVFSDILIPAAAMGLGLEIGDGGPVIHNPIRTAADVRALRDFDPEQETRFVNDAIRLLCRELGPDVPVLGFAGAPWTLACYLVEGSSKSSFDSLKKLMYADAPLLRELLDRIARVTARYLRAQIAAGATAVQLFDTWAGELARAEYEDFALPATQRVLAELQAGATPVILYTRGAAHLLPSVARAGATVLGVDWRVDWAELRQQLGAGVALQGNVDPCALFGPTEDVRRAAAECVARTGGLGHILNLGHGILPATPVENAKAFVAAGQAAGVNAAASHRV